MSEPRKEVCQLTTKKEKNMPDNIAHLGKKPEHQTKKENLEKLKISNIFVKAPFCYPAKNVK